MKKTIVPITSNFSADIRIEYEDLNCGGNIEFVNFSDFTSSSIEIVNNTLQLYDKIVDKKI